MWGKQCFCSWAQGQKYSRDGKSQPNTKVILLLASDVCKKMACACQERGQTAFLGQQQEQLEPHPPHPTFPDLCRIIVGKALHQKEIEERGEAAKEVKRKTRQEGGYEEKTGHEPKSRPRPKTAQNNGYPMWRLKLQSTHIVSLLRFVFLQRPVSPRLCVRLGHHRCRWRPRATAPWSDPVSPVRVTLCLYVQMWTPYKDTQSTAISQFSDGW